MTIKIAGIGPRAITPDGKALVTHVATQLADMGFHMNSGHGEGADETWAEPFPDSQKSLFIPWWGFRSITADNTAPFQLAHITPETTELARMHSPGWNYLTQGGKSLMIRNVSILLSGKEQTPVSAVLYWQEPHIGINAKGGTQHALRVAKTLGIPSFNINVEPDQVALEAWLNTL